MDDLIKMSVDEQLLTFAQALGEVTSQADKAQIGATLMGYRDWETIGRAHV